MSELVQRNTNLMSFDNLDTAMKWAEMIATSQFCPKDFKGKPGDVLVGIQYGQELGLKPMQALQNIAVINGRPSIWGDAMLAVCLVHPEFEYIDETFDDKTMVATCKVKRKNKPEQIRTYSKARAEKAGLWGKQGPWRTDPERMLQMRARGFALRDNFADALKGMYCAEELIGYPEEERDITPKDNLVSIQTSGIAQQLPSPIEEIEDYKQLITDMATKDELEAIYKHYTIENLEPLHNQDLQKIYTQLTKRRAA